MVATHGGPRRRECLKTSGEEDDGGSGGVEEWVSKKTIMPLTHVGCEGEVFKNSC